MDWFEKQLGDALTQRHMQTNDLNSGLGQYSPGGNNESEGGQPVLARQAARSNQMARVGTGAGDSGYWHGTNPDGSTPGIDAEARDKANAFADQLLLGDVNTANQMKVAKQSQDATAALQKAQNDASNWRTAYETGTTLANADKNRDLEKWKWENTSGNVQTQADSLAERGKYTQQPYKDANGQVIGSIQHYNGQPVYYDLPVLQDIVTRQYSKDDTPQQVADRLRGYSDQFKGQGQAAMQIGQDQIQKLWGNKPDWMKEYQSITSGTSTPLQQQRLGSYRPPQISGNDQSRATVQNFSKSITSPSASSLEPSDSLLSQGGQRPAYETNPIASFGSKVAGKFMDIFGPEENEGNSFGAPRPSRTPLYPELDSKTKRLYPGSAYSSLD